MPSRRSIAGDTIPSPFVIPARSQVIKIEDPRSGQNIQVKEKAARATASDRILLTSKMAAVVDGLPKSPISRSRDHADDEEFEHGFNIYARPFVPQAITSINKLGGLVLNTPLMKSLDFGSCTRSYVGLNLLPQVPTPIDSSSILALHLTDDTVHTNYEQYFRYHLQSEIESQQEENESYSLYMHEVTIIASKPGYLVCSFEVPGLRENSPYVEEDDVIMLRQLHPTLQIGGSGGVISSWTGVIYNGRVSAIQRKDEKLFVTVAGHTIENANFHIHYSAPKPSLRFNIQFTLPIERYIPLQQALSIVQEAFRHSHNAQSQPSNTIGGNNAQFECPRSRKSWLQSMLFPIEIDCGLQADLNPGFFKRSFFDEQLNWEQKKSVESICSQDYGILPFLISGPPGTGKTKTLVEVALQLLKGVDKVSHILFCAPSDPAADTFVQRISAFLKPNEMLRLNRPGRTFAEVPGSVLSFCYISQEQFDIPPLRQIMSYKLVVTTCRDASILLYSRLTNCDLYAAEFGLRSIIHPETRDIQVTLHWSALLMDESAQAIEPEALIPLSIVAPPSGPANLEFKPLVVMAGDEHQLGPRTSLRSTPLKTSLFARLFSRPVYAEHPLARCNTGGAPPALNKSMLPINRPSFANLIRNYRSHPAILAVPSALFYADTLEPEATDTNRLAEWPQWRGKGWPVLFHDNDSVDDLEKDGGGWYNTGEARIACEYAALLVKSGLVAQKEICIMSPFKAQVQRLRKMIHAKRYGSLWEVDIGPTEAFQGLERGIVILCTTRSRLSFVEKDKKLDWGIVGLPNKMNVALTRAKFGLIVIGKKAVLASDPNWKAFLDFCERNGLVTEVNGVDVRGGDDVKVTRLEKVLLAHERDLEQPEILGGIYQDDEMWTAGMQAAMDDTHYEVSDYDNDEDNDGSHV